MIFVVFCQQSSGTKAKAMVSADGESVAFTQPVLLDKPVEVQQSPL